MAIIQSLPLGGSSSTYTNMTTDEAIAGTNTEERVVSAKVLNDAIDTKISDLVNSAPETLDTLNELASALGNDPNFATTIAGQIGSKANDSDVVHKSGNETINGTKTFNDLQIISYGTQYKGSRDAYILPEFAAGYSGLSITTLSYSQTLKIGNFVLDANNKPVLDTSKAYIQFATGENNNVNTCGLEPRNSTSSYLGTSSNKWKDVYATTLHGDVDFPITEAQIAAIVV